MKKVLLLLAFLFSLSTLYSQSETMISVVEGSKVELINNGWEILEEGYLDINDRQAIESSEFTYKSQFDYVIVLTVDNCYDCKPFMIFREEENDLELECHGEQMQSVYLLFSVFTKDEDITGQFIGKTETVEWRKAHLMLAGKWSVVEDPEPEQ